jgi:hypothetical protein
MQRKLGLTAVLVVALAVAGYAQKPDFSGVWTPDAPAAAPAAPAGGGGGGGGRGMGGGPMTVTHKGDTLTIERTMGENKVSSTYKLDGTESVNKMMGRGGEVETKSTAKWDGAKLTIVTKQAAPDGSVRESTQSWSLEGGNLVVESTRTGREGAPVTAKTTYKKTT